MKDRGIEFRKVQFTGNSSFIVALPKTWARDTGLRQGDTLAISREKNNSLVIKPQFFAFSETHFSSGHGIRNGSTTIDLDPQANNHIDSAVRKATSLYLAGHTEINLTVASGRKLSVVERKAIRELVRKTLVATEVISDSSDGVSLRVLLTGSQLSAKDAIKRSCLMTTSMNRDAMHALSSLDESVLHAYQEVRRLRLYVLRQLGVAINGYADLSSLGLSKHTEIITYWNVIKLLQRISSNACKIASGISKKGMSFSDLPLPNFRYYSLVAVNLIEESLNSFVNEDSVLADKAARGIISVQAEMDHNLESVLEGGGNISRSMPPSSLVRIAIVLDSLRDSLACALEITEAVFGVTDRSASETEKPGAQQRFDAGRNVDPVLTVNV